MELTMPLTESFFPAIEDEEIVDLTVGDILRIAAKEDPDKVALVETNMECQLGQEWTYQELLQDSERVAYNLLNQFNPGDKIAVWSPNTAEWVILEFACALSGMVLVTVNPSYQANELHYVLEQSQSSALYLIHEYRGNPMLEIAQKATKDLLNIKSIIDMDNKDEFYGIDVSPVDLPEVKPSDAAQIQYTSGTTGFPKGAVLHHLGLINNARLCANRVDIGRDDVWLNFMPMFHTSGCALALLGCVQKRGKLILIKFFDPPKVNALTEQEKGTTFFGVPTMLIALLDSHEVSPVDYSSVKIAISGGSMVAPELVRRVKNTVDCSFSTVYGQTETSPVLTQTFPDDSEEDICNTVGQPLPNKDIAILDPQTSEVLPLDTIGEICSRGYCNMLRYNDNPEATKATIGEDGWLHTGDLGSMDERGYVKITGRLKEMIIRGGENLFPAEIENTLLEHPAVAEVAVVGIPDPKWGEIVGCFIRPVDGTEPKIAELIAHCRQYLSPVKTPTKWMFVEEWPLTGSGKIQKFNLLENFEQGAYQEETA